MTSTTTVAAELPSSDSPDLHLAQPTAGESLQIWSSTASSWKDSLTVPLYITEARYLSDVPLAKDGGMTTWVLVDKTLPPGQRQVLCSCESFRKRSLVSDENGTVKHGLVHGIASVFCPAEFRGRGYGSRHMRELAQALRGWQSEHGPAIGSVLYSDIGKEYYAKMGWMPNPTNGHYVFTPATAAAMQEPSPAQVILESDLKSLCLRDEAMIYKAMATPSAAPSRVVILPDLDHMLWHIRKEDFATMHLFGSKAGAKGAIAGYPGRQVWAVWVRRYYCHPDRPVNEEQVEEEDEYGGNGNVLYILRLVIEGDDTANKPHEPDQPQSSSLETAAYDEQGAALQAVLQAAQAEAAEWRLDYVKLWEPSPLAHSLIKRCGLDATWVERQEGSVACALWYGEDGTTRDKAPVWINNEHYAWC